MKVGKRKNRIKKTKHNSDEKKNVRSRSDLLPISSLAPSYLPKRHIRTRDISPDELMFAHEWVNNPKDPDKALLAAGITTPKDPKSIRDKLVQEYTTNPKVIAVFQESMFNKLESIDITSNRIDSHLSVVAFTDRGLCKDKDGETLPLHKMSWEMRQCVQEFEERMYYPPKGDPYKKTRIKFYSTVDALRILKGNKKDEQIAALGASKITGTNSTINIQNNYNSHNSYNNGDVYNSDIKQTLDVSRLNEQELNILLKAMGKQVPEEVQELENEINELIQQENKLDLELYPEPEPLLNMQSTDVQVLNNEKDAYFEPR